MESILGLLIVLGIVAGTEAGTLQITLSATGLPNEDIFDGQPDPYAIVHYSFEPSEEFFLIGETEHVDDVNDVQWTKHFNFTHIDNSQQRLRVSVMDADVDEDDHIGIVEVSFTEIVESPSMTVTLEIEPAPGKGNVTVHGKFVA